jgi:5'-3' exonuclease
MAFDTSYLYFRAYFGVPATFRAPDGRPVNAVRGTLDFISRLAAQYSPDLLACAWDDDWRPQWRVDLVPSYKTHRVVEVAGQAQEQVDDDLSIQVPIIRECLDAVGLPIVGVAEHEADDVLASLARQHDGASLVVTGDRDLFQLVDDDTSIVYVARGVAKHELVTPEVLAAKYALDASRYVDFAVLRGDPSDGLPGVKGIGEKSAAGLVAAYPTLEAIVEAATDPASGMSPAMRSKLTADVSYLARAREVVTAVDTLPLPDLTRRPVNHDKVEELTERYALGGALTRLAATAR